MLTENILLRIKAAQLCAQTGSSVQAVHTLVLV